jgi:catechol 2,3-dioxygenase-like lactoylglutathione lyase family enzyme
MESSYDRSAHDIGNIVGFEHVNTAVPDQKAATHFYINALGLTRDPYMSTGTENMWINVGRTQFHLPTRKAQLLRGHVGIVIPDREALVHRLVAARKNLEGSSFECHERDGFVEATSPWGNRVRCYEPDERFGHMKLGIPYVEFEVPAGTANGIAHFYREVMGAPATFVDDGHGCCARVVVGVWQSFVFRETDRPLPPFDGHHVQIYIADFSGPHRQLRQRGLITEESSEYQYRFRDIVDPQSGRVLYTLEHEVRSMTHPLYGRQLVNRNPAQTQRDYVPGHDAFV